MASPPRPAFPRLPGQYGLATVAQLLELGWTTSALRAARATRWQEPMPRVVAPHRGPLDADTRLVAAGLWAGPKAVLSGGVALSRLGLKVARPDGTTFVIPESSRARRHRQVQSVRSTRPPSEAVTFGVVKVAGPARALADAAVYERHGNGELEHLTISALQRGLTTPEAVEKELWLRPEKYVAAIWKGLEAFVGGAWSRPEATLRAVVDGDGGFPVMVTNCRLESLRDGKHVGTPDGYLEEAGVAIQVESRTHHQGIDDRGGDRWGRTVERNTDLVAVGVRVVGVTPWTLYSRPQRFLANLRRVVELGLAGPRPAVRVVPREK